MASEIPDSTANRNLPAQSQRLQKVKRIAINAFIIFHLIAIVCWSLPVNNSLIHFVKESVRPYLVWSGLFQSWDMFSPDPKSVNSYLEAVVIYTDGTSQLWSFPRMELLGAKDRYFKERYRKYEENLQNNNYPDLWPDAARYIARLNSDSTHRVQKVLLVVRWSDIIPRSDNSYDRGPWDVNVFYTYTVKPEDLQ
jgi:hypothetical protein